MSKRKSTAVPLGLGARIKAARQERGWTQPELGKRVGVSKSAVNQWENGAVQNLKLGNLFAVATVLGLDVGDLVFGSAKAGMVTEVRVGYGGLTPAQLAFLEMYEQLPDRVRKQIRALVSALVSNQQK